MDKKTIILKNNLEELQRVSGDLDLFLKSSGLSDETIYAAHFAVEEMVSNVIKYGFRDSLPHDILLEISIQNRQLKIVIEDDGIEFNPLSIPPKDTDVPLEEREVGGLGIHLVRKMVEDMSYCRKNGRNRLEITLQV